MYIVGGKEIVFDDIYFLPSENSICVIDIKKGKSKQFSMQEMLIIKKYIKTNMIGDGEKELINKWKCFIEEEKNIIIRNESQEISPVIIPSFNCNYNCEYCYQKKRKGMNDVISIDMLTHIDLFYDKYCDFFCIEKKYGRISIMGGEPLLKENKDVIKEIFNIWDENLTIVTTNGVNMSMYKEVFEKKHVEFHISLDGVKKWHFNRRHAKEEYYNMTVEGIKWALKENKRVYIMSVFDSTDINQYVEFFDFLEELGWLKNENLKLHFNLEIKEGCDSITNDELEKANKALMELIKIDKRVLYASLVSFVPGMHRLGDLISSDNSYGIYRCSCLGMPNYTFMPNGDVTLCSMSLSKNVIIGTYYPEVKVDFEKIISLKKRNIINMNKCKECSKALLCKGGCIASALSESEDIYMPYCGIWRDDRIFEYFNSIRNEQMKLRGES